MPYGCPTGDRDQPPDLAEVARDWHRLPDAVRAGILAMVRASVKGGRR